MPMILDRRRWWIGTMSAAVMAADFSLKQVVSGKDHIALHIIIVIFFQRKMGQGRLLGLFYFRENSGGIKDFF